MTRRVFVLALLSVLAYGNLQAASRVVALDAAGLAQRLRGAPHESAPRSEWLRVSLPMPEGGEARFAVAETPVLAPELARRYPEIRTWAGQGVDDPSATVRLDVTPQGFHAMVLSGARTILIDPETRGDLATSVVTEARDLSAGAKRFRCELDASRTHALPAAPVAASNGATRREYRLALAADGEYTQFQGGTKPLALSAMTTTMNRVNGIYEKEVAVRFLLVANDDLLIYTDPATDPYTNDNGTTMLAENQVNVDAVIGANNYDVGHVFSTGGGGLAQLGSACDAASKAMGVTGSSSPTGDAFDVDFVCHELGHQLGANHSFNSTTGNCAMRNAATAYEPGSGSTIMGYAGTCDAADLQPNSDPYFHAISFDEIVAYIAAGGDACANKVATGNNPPSVSAGTSHTIPAGTPFTLTASGSDPDGDPLTFAWEEFDLGTAAPPDADDGTRPIFRSFAPTSALARTFPRLADILSGTPTFGETLPVTSRAMTFRVTARDNRTGGGGVASATTTVTTTTSAGPFMVTAPSTAVSWTGGSTQQVTWDAAGTASAPVSCANVKITFSSDGGATFPTTVAASVPNNGAASITVPNIPTTTARIAVGCTTNVFFDVNHASFTVVAGTFASGDVNGDGSVNVSDVFYLINRLFAGGPPPVGKADVNNDGLVNVSDVFYLINYLFAGGSPPV
jgi:hypothetical protein